MDDVTRIYSHIPSISAEAGFVDDIRNGDLVPDLNGGGEYDERLSHVGFMRFLGSDLSRDILGNMKESEQMYEWG